MSGKLDLFFECYASSHTSGAEEKDVSTESGPIGECVHPLTFLCYQNVYHTLLLKDEKVMT